MQPPGQTDGAVVRVARGPGRVLDAGVELASPLRAIRAAVCGTRAELRVEIHHELRVQFYWLVTLLLAILSILLTVLATGLLG